MGIRSNYDFNFTLILLFNYSCILFYIKDYQGIKGKILFGLTEEGKIVDGEEERGKFFCYGDESGNVFYREEK